MYARRYCCNVELVSSVCPSVCGWNAVLNLLSIPNCLVVSFHKSDVNMDPLSVMMSLGSPCSRNISFTNSSRLPCVHFLRSWEKMSYFGESIYNDKDFVISFRLWYVRDEVH